MASFLASLRIPLAVLAAAAFIVGAYFLAVTTAHPPVASATSEAELLAAIATKDSDGDGLPDWEESLYGTDPSLYDSKNLGMGDGEAVAKGLIVPRAIADIPVPAGGGLDAEALGLTSPSPGTLTDVFAKNFFTTYVAARQAAGRDLTDEETAGLAAKALEQLASTVQKPPDFRTMAQISVSGSGAEALRAYAAAAEQVLAAHTTAYPKSELEYLKEAVDGDQSVLGNIKNISVAYREIATGLSVLSVPSEAKEVHLAIINAVATIGNVAGDFARYDTDPLSTMLALALYKDAVLAMGNGFMELSKLYARVGVVLAPGEAGERFVHAIQAP